MRDALTSRCIRLGSLFIEFSVGCRILPSFYVKQQKTCCRRRFFVTNSRDAFFSVVYSCVKTQNPFKPLSILHTVAFYFCLCLPYIHFLSFFALSSHLSIYIFLSHASSFVFATDAHADTDAGQISGGLGSVLNALRLKRAPTRNGFEAWEVSRGPLQQMSTDVIL